MRPRAESWQGPAPAGGVDLEVEAQTDLRGVGEPVVGGPSVHDAGEPGQRVDTDHPAVGQRDDRLERRPHRAVGEDPDELRGRSRRIGGRGVIDKVRRTEQPAEAPLGVAPTTAALRIHTCAPFLVTHRKGRHRPVETR